MAKMLAFHSYKGGAGKTFLSVNTAGMLAKMGNKVCLLDFDFHAPSLLALFKVNRPRAWVNDFLAGKYEIQKAIVELDSKNDSTGRLFVGFANPNFRAILAMNDADKRKELQVLEKILALRRELFEIESFDYVLLDAGPGLNYSSVNAIVASDFAVLVTTLDLSYTEGTARMIRDIYRVLEKKFGLLINKAFDVSTKAKKIEVERFVENNYGVPLIGILPCFCDVSRAEGAPFFALDKPTHPFSMALQEILTKDFLS